tara:strand:- start:1085 stop:1765 length:681 start_codon:yes stop_codon:yes gene_type:complete
MNRNIIKQIRQLPSRQLVVSSQKYYDNYVDKDVQTITDNNTHMILSTYRFDLIKKYRADNNEPIHVPRYTGAKLPKKIIAYNNAQFILFYLPKHRPDIQVSAELTLAAAEAIVQKKAIEFPDPNIATDLWNEWWDLRLEVNYCNDTYYGNGTKLCTSEDDISCSDLLFQFSTMQQLHLSDEGFYDGYVCPVCDDKNIGYATFFGVQLDKDYCKARASAKYMGGLHE